MLFFGTFLTLMCKPMFVLLSTVYGIAGVGATVYWFFFAKLLDRLSKGIREAPTKAVMNELARESGDAPDAAYGGWAGASCDTGTATARMSHFIVISVLLVIRVLVCTSDGDGPEHVGILQYAVGSTVCCDAI